MTRLLTTLAICLGAMVILSDQVNAADYRAMGSSSETKTAFFQPRPGGVLDVVTSPFRAVTTPVNYNRGYQQRAYTPAYGQSNYGSTNCVNGNCYTGSSYQSPCANGQCGTGIGCSTGNCSTGNCPGGNCGVRYLAPTQNYQNYSGYRGINSNPVQQYPAYRPVSQPNYQTYRPSPTSSILNDPFFP
tara:strand:+ start:120114 stop:120674 length:561 start_codon:yes stop_codon:yes gene_type:complete